MKDSCLDVLLPSTRAANGSKRAVSFRSGSISRGFPSLELDTVVEERSDPEQTQVSEDKLSIMLLVER